MAAAVASTEAELRSSLELIWRWYQNMIDPTVSSIFFSIQASKTCSCILKGGGTSASWLIEVLGIFTCGLFAQTKRLIYEYDPVSHYVNKERCPIRDIGSVWDFALLSNFLHKKGTSFIILFCSFFTSIPFKHCAFLRYSDHESVEQVAQWVHGLSGRVVSSKVSRADLTQTTL